MRFNTALVLAAVTLASTLALADVPPPEPQPFGYTAPTSTTLAGLHFVVDIPDDSIPEDPSGYIFISSCISTHPNCRLAKQKGVVGWIVTAVNGVAVDIDLGAFKNSFNSSLSGQKVKMTLEYQDGTGTPPKVKKLVLSFDPE